MTAKRNHASKEQENPENWVAQYGNYLFGFALKRVRDRSAAEELVQETFLAAIRSLDRFEGRSTVKTWLTGILKFKIIDHFRKSSREVLTGDDYIQDRQFKEDGTWGDLPARWKSDPQKLYEQGEFMNTLYRCLAKLTEKTATVFMRKEMDGYATEEICKELGITATNCWVIMHRARSVLRKCLENNWFLSGTKG